MERIILDVDTGHDDAAAIILAAGSKKIVIEGITVVAGNQVLEKTVKNTLNVCDALHIETGVYAGIGKPLFKELCVAALIHGESGYDGPVFENCKKKIESKHAVNFIIDTINANLGVISLLASAPLTNIAAALIQDPSIAQKVKQIILMGGCCDHGNITPSAEFNIFEDPESASIVFSSGAPIVMMGLEATKKVLITYERLEHFRKIPTHAARIFCDSMEKYIPACNNYLGEYPAMHDPCCCAWLLEPEIFECIKCNVAVELKGEYTYGRTVVDKTGISRRPQNALVAVNADEKLFWPLFENSLRALP